MFTIYKITNEATGRTYIGMTEKTLPHRFIQHKRMLERGTHTNDRLQADHSAGRCALTIKAVARKKTKSAAMLKELEFINNEPKPYNIRTGNPGDFIGRMTSPRTARPYVYAEIIALRGKANSETLMNRFGFGKSMISMIQNGHRTAPAPETSFADVFCDVETKVDAINTGSMKAFYQATQVGV